MTDHRAPRLDAVELRRLALPLVKPFRTSFGTQITRDILLVRVITDQGEGWGECVAGDDPLYLSEWVGGAHDVIRSFLVPRLAAAPDRRVAGRDVAPMLAPVKGHQMAKGALEMAVLDAELRARGESFAQHIGVERDRIPSGVSVSIYDTPADLLTALDGYLADGYIRIKLKIEPGRDIDMVRAARRHLGDGVPLQVDANTAYTRSDGPHLSRLDEFDLLLIEQPLAEDDLLGHASLAKQLDTPMCLDESIMSLRIAEDAIDLGACEIINIKAGRVGGYLAAVALHDLARARGIPVWCGGMLETGIGRAANAALAALGGFTLPGDVSASTRFWARDIVTEPITVVDGHVAVPTGPGFGFEIDHEFLEQVTTAVEILDLTTR
jgi:o-succinylbenzoate synthase